MGPSGRIWALLGAVAIPLAVSACVASGDVELPRPDGMASALVVFGARASAGARPLALLSVDLTASAPALGPAVALARDAEMFALYYPETLEELQLGPAGRLLPLGAPAPNRGLPAWASARRLGAEAREATEAERARLEAALAGVRVPSFDPVACVEGGGCLAARGRELCTLPCPAPPGPSPVAPPAAPTLELVDCPDGQAGLRLDAAPFCGLERAVDCPLGEAVGPDGRTCRAVGEPCPSGQWPEGLPVGTTYVAPGALGGDGTKAAPYGSIAEALAATVAGSTVALARGVYEEEVVLHAGVTLAGACAAETSVLAPVGAFAAVRVRGAGGLRDLSLARGDGAAVFLEDGARAWARGVSIDGGAGDGWRAASLTRSSARDLVVRGRGSAGLRLELSAEAWLEDVTLDAGLDAGLVASGAQVRVDASRVRIRGASPGGAGLGRGFVVDRGATAVVRGLVVADVRDVGVRVEDPGSSATIDRVLVRRVVRVEGSVDDAQGLHVSGGARVRASALFVEDIHDNGVRVQLGGSLALEDLRVRRVLIGPFGQAPGPGLSVDGATLSVARARLEALGSAGVIAGGGAITTLRDVEVAEVAVGGRGVEVRGDGLRFRRGAVRLERVRVAGCAAVGMVVEGDGRAVLTVRDLEVRAASGGVLLGAAVEGRIERAHLEALEHYGLRTSASGARGGEPVRVDDLRVVDVRRAPTCGAQACGEVAALELLGRARLVMSRFSLSGAGAAVQVNDEAAAALSDGAVVHGTNTALSVDSPAQDPLDLLVRVVLEGTGTRLRIQ